MRFAVTVLCLSIQLSCFADEEESALEGEWEVIAMRHDGRPDGGASFQGMKWAFSNDGVTVWAGTMTPAGKKGKPPMRGKFVIDDSTDPKQLTLTIPRKEEPYEITAIYRFRDDQLFICLGTPTRPKTFDTAGTKNLCYELRPTKLGADKRLKED